MSSPGSCPFSSATTRAMLRSSLYAGTSSRSEPDHLEQLPRAMTVRVLVEHALSRTAAEFRRLSWIVEELAIGVDRLLGRGVCVELRSGFERALDHFVGIGDDRRS